GGEQRPEGVPVQARALLPFSFDTSLHKKFPPTRMFCTSYFVWGNLMTWPRGLFALALVYLVLLARGLGGVLLALGSLGGGLLRGTLLLLTHVGGYRPLGNL